MFSLEKHLFKSSFIIDFFDIELMSCLYISKINPLSVAPFAVIFSHSERCLFTLFVVSLAVPKLFSLISSKFFIFKFYFFPITLGGGS